MTDTTASSSGTATLTLPITGMTCASCVGHVTSALERVEGVAAAEVSLATERATLTVTPETATAEKLIAAVREAGYGVATEETVLRVGGMTCASCVGHVQSALEGVEGVVDVSVNLATERATVTRIAGAASLPDTKKDAINRLSYVEGHLAGVKRMVEEERYCVDILKQTYAIRRAIEKLETNLLEGHLHTCVIQGVREGREQQVLDELVELYSLADK